MKALLIAEKPSLRREIENIYKNIKGSLPYEITFAEQRGHLFTTLMPDAYSGDMKSWKWDTLPFHPEKFGGFRYGIIPEKKTGNFLTAKERAEAIKKELSTGKYDFVINAGDPDQEGELLIRTTLNELKNKLPVKRFWTNDLTPKAIENALVGLRDDDGDPMLTHLMEAALVRQHSDYRYGINLTRAASLKFNGRAQLGRVKTPILALVCRREDEIENFVPRTTYGVEAYYDKEFKGTLFNPKAAKEEQSDEDEQKDEEKAGIVWFDKKEDAEALMNSLGDKATVVSVTKKKETTYAPKLFKLATLQTEAGKHGYKADEVLAILQKLYEAKYLSYPRTDCEFLSSDEDFMGILKSLLAVPDVSTYIRTITKSDVDRVRSTKKWINDKALADAGHSALRPTTIVPDVNSLPERERFIYLLVVKRFVAMFLKPLIADKTVIVTDIDGNPFRSSGKTIVSKGYTELFGSNPTDVILPAVNNGDVLGVVSKKLTEKTTTCPKRYSDGELVAVCENPLKFLEDEELKKLGKELKIGTPATRAGIINELITLCKYMERYKEGKTERIRPTPSGRQLIKNLEGMTITKVDMTGIWEEKLQQVRDGILTYDQVNSEMMEDVDRQVEEIKNKGDVTALNNSTPDGSKAFAPIGTCPLCGKRILTGKKSYFCEGYKEGCKAVIFSEMCQGKTKVTAKQAKSLLDGETIELKMYKEDRNWMQKLKFDSTTGQLVFVKEDDAATAYKCPKCGKSIIKSSSVYKCSDTVCEFKLYTTICGRPITEAEVDTLFKKKRTGLLSGFYSKAKNKNFSGVLVLSPTGTTFEFPQKGK